MQCSAAPFGSSRGSLKGSIGVTVKGSLKGSVGVTVK